MERTSRSLSAPLAGLPPSLAGSLWVAISQRTFRVAEEV